MNVSIFVFYVYYFSCSKLANYSTGCEHKNSSKADGYMANKGFKIKLQSRHEHLNKIHKMIRRSIEEKDSTTKRYDVVSTMPETINIATTKSPDITTKSIPLAVFTSKFEDKTTENSIKTTQETYLDLGQNDSAIINNNFLLWQSVIFEKNHLDFLKKESLEQLKKRLNCFFNAVAFYFPNMTNLTVNDMINPDHYTIEEFTRIKQIMAYQIKLIDLKYKNYKLQAEVYRNKEIYNCLIESPDHMKITNLIQESISALLENDNDNKIYTKKLRDLLHIQRMSK